MTLRTALAPALLLVVAACAHNGAQSDQGSAVIITTTTPATTAPASTTAATTPDPAAGADAAPVTPSTTTSHPPATTEPSPTVGDPKVAAIAVAEFDQPVDLAVRPGDHALYIVEQPGRVVRLIGDERTVIADLTDRTASSGERGLLGLAFSPDGRTAYLDYTDVAGDTVIAEYPIDGDGHFDMQAERIVLTIDQPYSNHNGGDLEIGPDRMLYIAVGDGGSGGDPERNASDPSTLLGSLLRIDPHPDRDQPYTIPADNPFADGRFGDLAGAAEVWSWGLRNPWRFAFDPVNGDLWIADVGQNEVEEVNLVSPIGGVTAGRGVNFGWSGFEGDQRFNSDVVDSGPTMPVLTYRHGHDGCSISGGVPYRGDAIPDLAPAFVYSDYCSGIVWALDLDGQRNITLLDGFDSVSSVRAGPDGEIYVLELGGTLNRLILV